MKYLKEYNYTKLSDIKAMCERYRIENYTINQDGTVDVDGSVHIESMGLTKIPINFRNVTGHFYCHNNKLTSLEGVPLNTNYFYCWGNKLTSLDYCPNCTMLHCEENPIFKWWSKVAKSNSIIKGNLKYKLEAFIDLGINSEDPDFMNQEKIDLLL